MDIGLFEDRSHLRPSRELKHPTRSARTLKAKMDDRGLRAADIFLQMALDFQSHAVNHPLPARRRKARDWFLKTLDYASECSCKHVTILVGAKFEGESHKESLNRAADELNWRLEKARAEGLVLGVEAHVGSLTPRPKSAA